MSYRRQETEWPAGWLFDRLAEHFRGAEVFKDIDSIEPGDDFVEVITSAVGSCDVLLALIGDRWLTMTDDEGCRRIDNPDDFVRVEIEAALSRHVRVVPILVYGARMPRAQDLPASLAGLVRRQALELSVSRFDDDVTRLLKVLDRTLDEARTRSSPVTPLRTQAHPPQTEARATETPPPQTETQAEIPQTEAPQTGSPPRQTDTQPPQTDTQPAPPDTQPAPPETETQTMQTQLETHAPPPQTETQPPQTDTQAPPQTEAPQTGAPPPQTDTQPLPPQTELLHAETPTPPRGTSHGLLAAAGRQRWLVPAIAAVAIVLGVGTAVWLWPRLTTGTANTSNSTPPASSPPVSSSPYVSPTTTAEQPLLKWQSVGNPAAAIGGPAAAAYKARIWVVGGMGTAVRIYDPTTGQWADGPALPAALSYGALASDGQRLYYMGGIKDGVLGVRDVYVLDSPDGSWQPGHPLPQPRFAGAAAWDGHRVVFAGGAQGRKPRKAASDIWALTSGGWERVKNLPSPREHLAAASDGKGTVWFVGGSDVSTQTVSGEVDVLQGSTVRQSGSLPTPVQGLTAVWTSTSGACAIGGSTTPSNATPQATATVTCPRPSGWPELPQATGYATSASLGDTAYVITGNTMYAMRYAS